VLEKGLGQKSGILLFEGVVSFKEITDETNYYMGFHTLSGEGPFSNSRLRIFFKNENHIAWKDNVCIATSPDLICYIDPVTTKPIHNNRIQTGQRLSIFAFPCDPALRRKEVLQFIEPRHFGFDIDYIPLEERSL
jgi:DUF917 family protein